MLIWLVAWPSLALSGTCGEYDEASFILETKTLPSTESSGLAAARTRSGVFFTHDDSGAEPELFSFSLDGTLAETHPVLGARAVDWEDMAAAPCPTDIRQKHIEHCLYIGDIGDNPRNRTDIQVYVIAEPSKGESPEVLETWNLQYPSSPQDAEALLIHPGTQQITIVTKSTSGEVGVYTSPAPEDPEPVVLNEMATLSLEDGSPLGSMITGGDWDLDGERLILRTYTTLYLWETDPCETDAHWTTEPTRLQTTWEWQGEAICFDTQGGILTSSEGDPMAVSGIDCLDWTPGDGPCFPDDEADNDETADTGCPDDTSTYTPSGSTFHETHPNDSRSCSQGSRHAWVALLIGLGLRGRRRSSLPRDQSFN